MVTTHRALTRRSLVSLFAGTVRHVPCQAQHSNSACNSILPDTFGGSVRWVNTLDELRCIQFRNGFVKGDEYPRSEQSYYPRCVELGVPANDVCPGKTRILFHA